MRVDFVIETLRHILRLSATWSIYQAIVVSLDVHIAFDSINHVLLAVALMHAGAPTYLVAAVMEEFYDLVAQMSVAGIGSTREFAYHKGGRQGGVETPPIWNIIMDFLLGPLVRKWDEQKYGFARFCDCRRTSHASHHLGR